MKEQYPYFDLHTRDGSGIAFEHWTDSRSVALHRHGYYELFLIEKGSCRHMYREQETLLIPGDVVLIPPHSAHGFTLSGVSAMYICQFMPEAVDRAVSELMGDSGHIGTNRIGEGIFWEHLIADKEAYYGKTNPESGAFSSNSSKQGVVHLNPREIAFLEGMFEGILEESADAAEFAVLRKQKYAELILVELQQAYRRQNRIYNVHAGERQAAVAESLQYMEEHLTEPLDLDVLAEEYGFSTNYFRRLFREATGLSPVRYLNRLRITRACEAMQQEGMSAREAAEQVGFVDMNYFSRMFKQVMGCSPSRL